MLGVLRVVEKGPAVGCLRGNFVEYPRSSSWRDLEKRVPMVRFAFVLKENGVILGRNRGSGIVSFWTSMNLSKNHSRARFITIGREP